MHQRFWGPQHDPEILPSSNSLCSVLLCAELVSSALLFVHLFSSLVLFSSWRIWVADVINCSAELFDASRHEPWAFILIPIDSLDLQYLMHISCHLAILPCLPRPKSSLVAQQRRTKLGGIECKSIGWIRIWQISISAKPLTKKHNSFWYLYHT